MNLFINDLFHTIQGEGVNWGRRALFVRMPYCNLACSWCDTQFNAYLKWSEADFLAYATREETRFAVITGGEPLMHAHTPKVVELLKREGFELAVETNGTQGLKGMEFDFITCSPKRDADFAIDNDLWEYVNEFKYVVDEYFDFSILDRHKDDLPGVVHSLSPEFGQFKFNVDRIMGFITIHPEWKLSLQTHKWIGVA